MKTLHRKASGPSRRSASFFAAWRLHSKTSKAKPHGRTSDPRTAILKARHISQSSGGSAIAGTARETASAAASAIRMAQAFSVGSDLCARPAPASTLQARRPSVAAREDGRSSSGRSW
jgi:hypothetical protein